MIEAVELRLARLGVLAFRNLEPGPLAFAPRLNVISGENGQGKTSLIEAIYLLCTTRSFRTAKVSEVIQSGAQSAQLKGSFERGGLPWLLEAQISQRGRSFKKNGASPKERLAYVQSTPIVAFHPGDLALVTGPAALRRRLLDRLIVHMNPSGTEAKAAYELAARERLILLERRASGREIDPFEAIMAERGSALSRARASAVLALEERLGPTFARLARLDLKMEVSFRPGGTAEPEAFRAALEASRGLDSRRKATSFGPQRDDVLVSLDGRAARAFGSQGQQRMVALSLKLAELDVIREVSLTCPILLLDDVSSELDRERTEAVFRFLESGKNQVFLTTTRPELFSGASVFAETGRTERCDFQVEAGRIRPSPRG